MKNEDLRTLFPFLGRSLHISTVHVVHMGLTPAIALTTAKVLLPTGFAKTLESILFDLADTRALLATRGFLTTAAASTAAAAAGTGMAVLGTGARRVATKIIILILVIILLQIGFDLHGQSARAYCSWYTVGTRASLTSSGLSVT